MGGEHRMQKKRKPTSATREGQWTDTSDILPALEYNSLEDKHLTPFFRAPLISRHLKVTGLVSREGSARSERELRALLAREEQVARAKREARQMRREHAQHKKLQRQLTRSNKVEMREKQQHVRLVQDWRVSFRKKELSSVPVWIDAGIRGRNSHYLSPYATPVLPPLY